MEKWQIFWFGEVKETVNVSEWFKKNWPIMATVVIAVIAVIYFGWILSMPPPKPPPYP